MFDPEDSEGDKVPNQKLAAIEDLKIRFDASKARIVSWTTSTQRIPSVEVYAAASSMVPVGGASLVERVALGLSNPMMQIGGQTAEGLSDDLTPEVWDSPLAETFSTMISTAMTDVDNALSTMDADIASAKSYEEEVVGEMVEPGTTEAEWGK